MPHTKLKLETFRRNSQVSSETFDALLQGIWLLIVAYRLPAIYPNGEKRVR